MPQELPLLCAAATEEEIVVDFVICCRLGSIENRGRSAFNTYDSRFVCGVNKDVSPQAIGFPAKVFRIVEAMPDVNPVASMRLGYVCICSNPGHAQNRLFIGDVGTVDIIYCPVGLWQRYCLTDHAANVQKCVDTSWTSIGQTLDLHRL